MTGRDVLYVVLGWQLAVAFRFAADVIFDQWDRRRKARRTRTAEQTTP